MPTVRLPALRVVQNSHTFYVTVLKAGDLFSLAEIPRYNPATGKGYQRYPANGRIEAVGGYLLRKTGGLFPTAILLNSRKPVKFSAKGRSNSGTLAVQTIPKLAVVDGQTRMLGLEHVVTAKKKPEFRDFVLPVVITAFDSEIEEMVQFRIVNREAKSVPTGLTDRLIAKQIQHHMGDSGDVEQLADLFGDKLYTTWQLVRIADTMATKKTSPWRGRIKVPNAQGTQTGTISERSFTTSLKPALKAMAPIHDSDVSAALIPYWQAMFDVCKDAAKDPKNYPYLHKTFGVYVGHLIFASLGHSTRSRSAYRRQLERIKGLDSDLWAKNGPLKGKGGQGGFTEVAERLIEGKGPPPIDQGA